MSDISRQYHNLRYAIESLCDVIESCKIKKVIEEKYEPQLSQLLIRMKKVKQQLKDEGATQEKQKKKWLKKIHGLECDAILDETLTDDLKERIISGLQELYNRVETHGEA